MRHRKATGHLNRNSSLRKATIRDISRAIITYESIRTTKDKAKATRSSVESLITLGKKDTLAARRIAFKKLQDHRLVSLLFSEIAPRFKDRSGGYTRILNLNNRRGDNAEKVIFEFTQLKPKKKAKKEKTAEKESAQKPPAKEKKPLPEKDTPKPTQEAKKPPKKEEKLKKEETKKEIPQEKEEKTKKKFFSGLRKFIKKDKDSL
ncbi:50S ribosomal protein L17 [Candidatus Omnitrophota bacterium]